MTGVVLVTDGSPYAEDALEVAAALGLSDEIGIHVVHVVTAHQPTEHARRGVEVEFAHDSVERSRAALLTHDHDDQQAFARRIVSRHIRVHAGHHVVVAK